MTEFVILGVTIENKNAFRGMGVRFAALTKETLKETAQRWHTSVMDSHFTPGNQSRYSMQNRNALYLEKIKKRHGQGQGKWVLNKLSEKSHRWMQVFVNITGTSRQIAVRMRPPTYFANPFIGSWIDRHGKRKTITRQPDKPKEVTAVNDADRAYLKNFMEWRIRQKVNAALVVSSN